MNAPIHILSIQREAEKRQSLREYMRLPRERAYCDDYGLTFDASDLPEDSAIECPRCDEVTS